MRSFLRSTVTDRAEWRSTARRRRKWCHVRSAKEHGRSATHVSLFSRARVVRTVMRPVSGGDNTQQSFAFVSSSSLDALRTSSPPFRQTAREEADSADQGRSSRRRWTTASTRTRGTRTRRTAARQTRWTTPPAPGSRRTYRRAPLLTSAPVLALTRTGREPGWRRPFSPAVLHPRVLPTPLARSPGPAGRIPRRGPAGAPPEAGREGSGRG